MLRFFIRTALAAVVTVSGALCVSAQEWREVKGEHFIVLYDPSAPDTGVSAGGFAEEISGLAELHYRRIADELGYPRTSEFWTWDKRVKIYLYADKPGYIKSGNHPQWSSGAANYQKKQIVSFIGSTGFIEHVLPHEIAHLIFRDFIGFSGDVPLWVDEGVAQWAEEALRPQIRQAGKAMSEKDSLLLLTDMMSLNIRAVSPAQTYQRPTVTRKGQKAVIVLNGDALIKHYYIQASTLVGFLIERFGALDFAQFCRELRDGRSFEEAVRAVYTGMTSISELEQEWRSYLEAG